MEKTNKEKNKFILVYDQHGYPEAGGGQYYETFETIEELDSFASNILINGENGNTCEILFAGEVAKMFTYTPIESVIKYKRNETH